VAFTRRASFKAGRCRGQLVEYVFATADRLQQLLDGCSIYGAFACVRGLRGRQVRDDRDGAALADRECPSTHELDFDPCASLGNDPLALANGVAHVQRADGAVIAPDEGCSGEGNDGRDGLARWHVQ